MVVKATYTAVAERDDKWWFIQIAELPHVFSQAKRLDRVEHMARDVISLMLDVPADSFDVQVVEKLDPPTQKAIDAVIAAREAVAALSRNAAGKTREVVQDLHRSGYPQRDIGRLMRLSHQRVAQLLAETRGGTATAHD